MKLKEKLMLWQIKRSKKRIKKYKEWIEKEKEIIKEYTQDLDFEKYLKLRKSAFKEK
jgi:hypothetical protein